MSSGIFYIRKEIVPFGNFTVKSVCYPEEELHYLFETMLQLLIIFLQGLLLKTLVCTNGQDARAQKFTLDPGSCALTICSTSLFFAGIPLLLDLDKV